MITFNSLYKKIKESDEAGNTRETMYWYGRFTTLFINFEPIEDDTLSDLEDFEDDDDFLFATNFAAGLQTAQEALTNGVSIDRLLRQDYTLNREGPVV